MYEFRFTVNKRVVPKRNVTFINDRGFTLLRFGNDGTKGYKATGQDVYLEYMMEV